MDRISLTVTERQLKLINRALEDFFRMRMGQTYIDLLDDLCFQNIEPEGENGKLSSEQFDDAIQRRDMAREKLQELYDICLGPGLERRQKREDVQNAIDVWHVIRHWLWEQRPPDKRGDGTDSYPVFRLGTEPLPEIKGK